MDVQVSSSQDTLLCDVSTGMPCLVVPPHWMAKVFSLIHDLAHPAVKTTVRMVVEQFVWHGLKKGEAELVMNCTKCQTSKVQRHTQALIQNFDAAVRRFQHIHIDVVGPLPVSKEARYLLTVVDWATRWLEAIPIKKASVVTCTTTLVSQWNARVGVPAHITSERGHSSRLPCGLRWRSSWGSSSTTPQYTTRSPTAPRCSKTSASNISSKRERRSIELEVKQKVIKQHNVGKAVNAFARDLGTLYSTITTILKDKENIFQAVKGSALLKATRLMKMQEGPISDIETLLMTWIEDKHNRESLSPR
ncbi:protein NYNRIN-like [Narcine bancroftii]|uniref:protein NYNRIN-like n=1 Tax=Narcine bancroftii TaxID=1343680 RepID=UPI0038315EFD